MNYCAMFSQLNFCVFPVEPVGWQLPQMGLQYCNLWFGPFCWLLLHLQAEQIVTQLMMNMLEVDKRLAEEQSRQAMVSENTQNCGIWCNCILHELEMIDATLWKWFCRIQWVVECFILYLQGFAWETCSKTSSCPTEGCC